MRRAPDHEKYPAEELAALYARRWEIEPVFDEIKTHQRGRPVLRSQTPDGVRQEICAHLPVHRATRELLDEAARLHHSIAERTSFTRALHIVLSPSARKRGRCLGISDIGRSLLPRRRSRDCPRKIRSCITGYARKAPGEPSSSRPPVAVALNHRCHDHPLWGHRKGNGYAGDGVRQIRGSRPTAARNVAESPVY
ncbi:transposase [Kitasatospora cinereorecta]